jgi:hypothetical protein
MFDDSFTTLIFKGGRFQGAAMPLEALPELAAYRQLVIAVAKALWQREHKDRQRLPRGFERDFRLVMRGVTKGSTVPSVAREFSGQMSMMPRTLDFFDTARDLVEKTIRHAAGSPDLFSDFPLDVVHSFSAFGQTLHDGDEFILVGPPNATDGARYDRAVRKRILLSKETTYEDPVTLIGEVRAADKDTEGFVLRTRDGDRLAVNVPPLFFPVAMKSFGESVQVRVKGMGLYDRDGVLKRVLSASEVSLAEEDEEVAARSGSCAVDIEAQIESLRGLGRGWFDQDSEPLSDEGLSWISGLLGRVLLTFRIPTPYLYPTPDGHVRAEWNGPTWDLYAEFELTNRAVEVLASRIDSDEVHERQLSLSKPDAEAQMSGFLVEHFR